MPAQMLKLFVTPDVILLREVRFAALTPYHCTASLRQHDQSQPGLCAGKF